MTVVYSAVTCFDSSRGDEWQKYIGWSGLTHLREIVSLDGILCPPVSQDLTDEDWRYNVHEDYKTHLFRDLDYLLHKVAGNERVNILAVMQEPAANDLRSFVDPRFAFRGFDLIETQGSISALLNCGGFDKAFSSTDLSEHGLLTSHAKALTVQQLLRSEYPDEPHAECEIWAVWQKVLLKK